jgi:hypothetical protein
MRLYKYGNALWFVADRFTVTVRRFRSLAGCSSWFVVRGPRASSYFVGFVVVHVTVRAR